MSNPFFFQAQGGRGGTVSLLILKNLPEQVNNALQGADLPVDGVVVILQELELHGELVVDGAAALVLLHRDVQGPASHQTFAVLSFDYEVPARYVGF